MTILSEYQNGLRNARVYKTKNGEYGVVVYDANDDTEGYKSFWSIDQAEDFAEGWVVRYVTL
jgi:hypothetical protein